ncbi:MAG: GGDEF domain-containing protein [Deltaproteobacteria bacterium]|nr:GGDEF domain-containing protein [Deltaproteobacteria bacterium]
MRSPGPPHGRWSEEELAQLHLFRGLDPGSLEGVLESCTLRILEPGEVLARSGEIHRSAWFLLSGRLTVHRAGPADTVLALVDPGESVGEMALIDHQPASVWVVAEQPSRLLEMSEEVLWSLAQSSHTVACNLLLTVTRRLRHADEVLCGGVAVEPLYRRTGSVDPLTGLHNRAWLDRTLDRVAARQAETGSPFSILFLDVDRFRRLNRRFGHLIGDSVLQQVALVVVEALRPSELVARYGGDEFVVLLPGLDADEARSVADRVRTSVKEAPPIQTPKGLLPPVTVSVGVASASAEQQPSEVLAAADAALFRAKARGRNRVVVAGDVSGESDLVAG